METLESVQREARERLYPSLRNPSWLVLRKRREILKSWIARLDRESLDVLDVGGRIQPYRPLLEGRVRRYVAMDVRCTPLVNVVGRAEQIPLKDATFDLVLCMQVLEYIPDPASAIAEIHRVLKPGGCLFLSTPTLALRDSSEECWRFMPWMLRRMLSSFRESEIVPEGGSITGFFRTINGGLNVLVRYPALRTAFHWTLCPPINLCAEMLERMVRSKNDQLTTNYSAWARK
jgi:SAM-dependent methyltransferase